MAASVPASVPPAVARAMAPKSVSVFSPIASGRSEAERRQRDQDDHPGPVERGAHRPQRRHAMQLTVHGSRAAPLDRGVDHQDRLVHRQPHHQNHPDGGLAREGGARDPERRHHPA